MKPLNLVGFGEDDRRDAGEAHDAGPGTSKALRKSAPVLIVVILTSVLAVCPSFLEAEVLSGLFPETLLGIVLFKK